MLVEAALVAAEPLDRMAQEEQVPLMALQREAAEVAMEAAAVGPLAVLAGIISAVRAVEH